MFLSLPILEAQPERERETVPYFRMKLPLKVVNHSADEEVAARSKRG